MQCRVKEEERNDTALNHWEGMPKMQEVRMILVRRPRTWLPGLRWQREEEEEEEEEEEPEVSHQTDLTY